MFECCAKESEFLELSFNSTGVLVGSWLFFIQTFPCSVSFGCIHGDSVGVNAEYTVLVHWGPDSF